MNLALVNPARLFSLAPGESVKVMHFAGLGFLMQAGLALGINAGDSLFLARVGSDALPNIYILTPIMMLIYIPAFSALLGRFGIDRVFNGIMAALVSCGIGFWLVLSYYGAAPPILLCYAAKLYAGLWYVGLYTLFWTYVDDFFDLIDAKRFFALFDAGSATGAILAGTICTQLPENSGVQKLYLLWAVFAAAAWLMLGFIRRRWSKFVVAEDDGASTSNGVTDAVSSMWRSRYAMAIAIGLFLVLASGTLCDYQTMAIFSAGLNETQLSALFGRLTLGVNAMNMVIGLFLFNRLVSRFGVRNVALIQAVAFGLVFVWLIGQPGMAAATAGFFAFRGLMVSIDFNNLNLLFAGLPADRRVEIRTIIEGMCEPSASAAAGVFLLFVAPHLGMSQLACFGLAVSVLALAVFLLARRDYVGAIAANLRSIWFDMARRPSWQPVDDMRIEADIVVPILLSTIDPTPAGRRQAERIIVEVGAGAIPHLVEAAASQQYSVRARSIALRALGKLDLPRLQKTVGSLMQESALRAYEMLGRAGAIEDGHAEDAGSFVLDRVYHDYPRLVLEVVLEALTIAGRLPPYETIVVALGSGRSKERAFALETIEQGAGRKLHRLLAPWLGGYSLTAQLAHGRRYGRIPEMTPAEALQAAARSAFPLEAAAAVQALWTAGTRADLNENDPRPLVQQTLRVLIRRDAGTSDEATPVENVAALVACPAFDPFDFTQLEWLAPTLKTEQPAGGAVLAEVGAALERIYLVLAGTLIVRAGSAETVLTKGAVAGEAGLLGVHRSDATLIAGSGLRVLVVERHRVMACAEAFPVLGLELLRRRVAR